MTVDMVYSIFDFFRYALWAFSAISLGFFLFYFLLCAMSNGLPFPWSVIPVGVFFIITNQAMKIGKNTEFTEQVFEDVTPGWMMILLTAIFIIFLYKPLKCLINKERINLTSTMGGVLRTQYNYPASLKMSIFLYAWYTAIIICLYIQGMIGIASMLF